MLKLISALACLAACAPATAQQQATPVGFPPASIIRAEPNRAAVADKPVVAEAPIKRALTSVLVESTGAAAQVGMPLTFAQVFKPGDVPRGAGLGLKLGDASVVPAQVDVKARHPDGSLRHALISLRMPALRPGQSRRLNLVKTVTPVQQAALTPAVLLNKGFSARVTLIVDGKQYQADAADCLRQPRAATWLAGPVVSEWLLAAPLTDADGQPHPHLAARFAIRAYGSDSARVDVTIENVWAFESAPQNFVYDVRIGIAGKEAYARDAMLHYHHARWRKVLWWGAAPQWHVRHDTAYLIASRAVPNYDQSVTVGEAALAALDKAWTGPKTEPMGVGLAIAGMPTTGGRNDIGLLPGWNASYLLSMDRRARGAALGTADLAGSWSAHYRDRATGRPVSVRDYPYMTILGQRNDTRNPATGKLEAFPPCASTTACATPNKHDSAHQPGFAYLPYLLTGDFYYLEELQFWAMWNTFMSNPVYREHARGLVKPDQVRGQAWSLRTLGEAAYITPDADPLKAHFTHFVAGNLDWYNSQYTNNPEANKLGIVSHGGAVVYEKNTGIAPWMDDFFTAAIGHLVELGFDEAKPLLEWKITFPIARMTGPGACWISGAIYALKVRDDPAAPLYTSIGKAWEASSPPALAAMPCAGDSMAQSLKLKVGEMSGYANVPTGFPSNMQPALAYAADYGGTQGHKAWAIFAARSVKPDYGPAPQFAIIPRR